MSRAVLIAIPARYASHPLSGQAAGVPARAGRRAKTLIRRSWEAAMAVRGVDRVVVATDDDRIRDLRQRLRGRGGDDLVRLPERHGTLRRGGGAAAGVSTSW